MNATRAFPQAEPSDPDCVADALDAGILHWAKGEAEEALRCLRQAHAAADEAGDDRRALTLARAAAELVTEESRPTAPQPKPTDAGAGESSTVEPKRSRLPGLPAAPKKFTGASDSLEVSGDNKLPKRESASVTPAGVKPSTAPTSAVAPPLSVRPTPPSTRPNPGSTTTVLNSQSERVPLGTNKTVPPSVTVDRSESVKPPQAESGKPSNASNGTHAVTRRVGGQSAAANPVDNPTHGTRDAGPSQRPDGSEQRLTSLRVRIERIEPDGTIRVRAIDAIPTSAGAENAILVVSEALWQRLKAKNP